MRVSAGKEEGDGVVINFGCWVLNFKLRFKTQHP